MLMMTTYTTLLTAAACQSSAYPLLCDADDDNLYILTYSSGLPIWEKRFTMSAVIRHKSHNHHLLIWMRGKAPGTAGSKDGERWVSGRGGGQGRITQLQICEDGL